MTVLFLNDQGEFNQKIHDLNTILLDFDGTLVDYYENEANALSRVLRGQGIEEGNIQEIILSYRGINEKLWKLYEKKEVTVDQVRVDRFAQLNEIYGIELAPEKFNDLYIESFGTTVTAYPGITKSLSYFKKRHPDINLIILTNGINSTQLTRRQVTGLGDVTDGMVSSDLAGVAKPSPEIFEFASQTLGVDISKSIMVGDSLTSDIQGAVNVGIPNALIFPELNNVTPSQIKKFRPTPDMVVESCIEVLDYISRIRSSK